MDLLKRDTDYALRALAYIASKKDDTVSASQIKMDLDVPYALLRKSLQTLTRKGILVSKKGRGGGFMLQKPAEDISLLEVIEAFQGDFSLGRCIFKKKICPEKNSCILRKKIKDIQSKVEKQLEEISVRSLIKEE